MLDAPNASRFTSRSLAVLLALALPLAGCARTEARGTAAGTSWTGKLTITGSSTVAPLVLQIAARFEERHPGLRIDVQTGGSSRGVADARAGLADVGMVSRALRADEAAGLSAHEIARDGVALIVHATNDVPELSADDVRAVYRGEVERWSQLGGPENPITVLNKASGRATLEVFLEHFGLAEREIEADVVIGDNAQALKLVAGDPHAIGYVSIGAAEHAARAGAALRLLPVEGVPATTAHVAAGEFPLVRPLNLVTAGEPRGLARAFIEFSRSREVEDLVTDLCFVPLTAAE